MTRFGEMPPLGTSNASDTDKRTGLQARVGWTGAGAVTTLVAVLFVSTAVSHGQQGSVPYPMKDTSNVSPLSRTSNSPNGDMGDDLPASEQQKRMAALNKLRRKEMTEETAKLLALATDLHAHVDAAGRVEISPDTLHKAEQIQKLAHSVGEKMKASVLD